MIIPETSFNQIFFKESSKASEITLNLKLTNKNVTNRYIIVNFEDTRGRWSDISMSQVVGLKKGNIYDIRFEYRFARRRNLFIIFYYETIKL